MFSLKYSLTHHQIVGLYYFSWQFRHIILLIAIYVRTNRPDLHCDQCKSLRMIYDLSNNIYFCWFLTWISNSLELWLMKYCIKMFHKLTCTVLLMITAWKTRYNFRLLLVTRMFNTTHIFLLCTYAPLVIICNTNFTCNFQFGYIVL